MKTTEETIIAAEEASLAIMPGLPKGFALPSSVLIATQATLEDNYPSLLKKARNTLERARKKKDTALPPVQTRKAVSFVSLSDLKHVCEEQSYYPTPEFLELARLEITKWLATKAAASDVFRLWCKKYRNPTPTSSGTNPNPKETGAKETVQGE